ncbi:MAG: outer membrane beta-barrel protein [Rikenellaceae bacterium]
MKRVFLAIVGLLTTTSVLAQQSAVKGSLKDSYTAEGVIGAIVELEPLGSSKAPTLTTSGYDGVFTFNSISYGEYIIKAEYMGYENFADTIKIESPRVILGNLKIKESSTQIDAVVKEVQALRTSQRGDTLSYSAAAFKVALDADVEGLLKKMPGITVDSGEVTAQGETIKKIYVDGREFFGNDVATAISTLPAEIVDNIEVFDKLSDNAELSGMDDGDGFKSINIVTKAHMREGFFGELYAGYGYQPEVEGETDHNKYLLGGNVNYFKDKHRFTVLGMFNNLNQQDFSFNDILGVSDESSSSGKGRKSSSSSSSSSMTRSQSGVATVQAFGLNYSGTFGANDKVAAEASYFYNGTQTDNLSTTERWYEDPLAIDTLMQAKDSYTPNLNHRFTGRLDWKISPTQQLTLRQSASYQSNEATSNTLGAMYGESGYNIIDTYSLADKAGYNSSTSLSYITRLWKVGRTIAVNGSVTIKDQDNASYGYSNGAAGYSDSIIAADTVGMVGLYGETLYDLNHTAVLSPTSSLNLSADVSYAEPLSSKLRLTLGYSVSSDVQETKKSTYNTDAEYNYNDADINLSSSNAYESSYLTHKVGPGLFYSDGKNKFSANAYYQYAELSGNAKINGSETSEPIENSFTNFTYSAMAQIFINQQNTFRMYLSTRTSNPNVNYLVDAYDLTNTKYISKGNPDLIPSYTTNMRIHYIRSNVEKGTTFMLSGSVSGAQDYIGDHLVYYPDNVEIDGESYSPIEYSTSVNLDEYWKYSSTIEYGFPISFIKSNFNVRGGVSYALTPSMIGGTILTDGTIDGGELNHNKSLTYSLTTVLGSNISENVDFTLSWNGAYSEAINTASLSEEINEYFSQKASLSSKFVFGPGLTLSLGATYNQYRGITNDYNESFVLCNAFIGKKIFKNKRGELNVGVNDLFDQNTSFTRSVGTGYTQNTYNSVIGRYFSIQLVYNLRSFGGQQGGGQGGRRGGGGGTGGGGGRRGGF